MALTIRENWLRAVEFRYPEWIPCRVAFSPITWRTYRQELLQLIRDHPRIFPPAEYDGIETYEELPVVYRPGEYFRDNWGCIWYTEQEGLEGQVVGHPLSDWNALDGYTPPDPLVLAEREPRDWADAERTIAERRAKGLLTVGNGERLFDRLYFLRGFDNLMMDFAMQSPQLACLIEMLQDHELRLIDRWLQIGVDVMAFHTDIGTQKALMISPASFRQYIKPLFATLFQHCRQAGSLVSLSSDGNLLAIVDDLIECGVSVHDPQLRANSLEGIARAYKGKLCANVDLDRQGFPFMTPQEIREQIQEVVDVMALPEGGLMLLAAVYGRDVPWRNIEAICDAMEQYCFP